MLRSEVWTNISETAPEPLPKSKSKTPGEKTDKPSVPKILFFQADNKKISLGEPIHLSWEIEGSTLVQIDQGIGEVTPKSAIKVIPRANTVYTITAGNAHGEVSAQVSLTLEKPKIKYFKAEESEILIGFPTILHWSVENAESLYIDKGVGEVDPNQSFTEAFFQVPGPCTITAVNASGSVRKKIQLKLPLPEISFFEAANQIVRLGEPNLLMWKVSNVTELYIDHGIGEVTGKDKIEAHPDRSLEYTLTAVNHSGSVQMITSVILPPPKINFFEPTKEVILEEHESVTLVWEVENAYELSIDNEIGDVTGKTQINVKPHEAFTTYCLTAKGHSGIIRARIDLSKFPVPVEQELLTEIDNDLYMDNLNLDSSLPDSSLDVDIDAAFNDLKDGIENQIAEAHKNKKDGKQVADFSHIEITEEMMNLERPKMREELKKMYESFRKVLNKKLGKSGQNT